MAEENKSESQTGSKNQATKPNNRNRVQFRVREIDIWIYKDIAKFLAEKGYIRKQSVSEAAKFSLDLYAFDHMEQRGLLVGKLNRIIPVVYYEKLAKELESERQLRMFYEQENKACLTHTLTQLGKVDTMTGSLKTDSPTPIIKGQRAVPIIDQTEWYQWLMGGTSFGSLGSGPRKTRPDRKDSPNNDQP